MSLDSRILGCIRVQPPLNDVEREFLDDVRASDRTLRGTPTGRGDTTVPFARLAWTPCPNGCCLTWTPYIEDPRWMVQSLRFVVDHLLRPGAKGQGHHRLAGFTFDHVVSGVVIDRDPGGHDAHMVAASDNQVSGPGIPASCEATASQSRPAPDGARFDNVIELRPRRA